MSNNTNKRKNKFRHPPIIRNRFLNKGSVKNVKETKFFIQKYSVKKNVDFAIPA